MRNLGGIERHVFLFVGAEIDVLRKFRILYATLQRSLKRLVCAVFHQRGHSQMCLAVAIKFRNYCRISHRHRTAGAHADLAEQTHILVGRRRVPVHEGDGQISVRRRKYFDRQDVCLAYQSGVGDVELIGAPGTRHVIFFRDLLAIQKDVGAIVDAGKIQPDGLALIACWQRERLAIPPRHHKRAVLLHGDI